MGGHAFRVELDGQLVVNCLQIQGGPFKMGGHAFRVEVDGQLVVTFHQLIHGVVFG